MKYRLSCRETGAGAETRFVNYTTSNPPRVVESSGSGNHWTEEFQFANNMDAVGVMDVSSSGRHSCRILQRQDNRPEPVVIAQADGCTQEACPVCSPGQ